VGLGLSLSNALSGMRSTQASVDVVSRNVSNVGTPGYHRQSIKVLDYTSTGSSYVRSAGVDRAFNKTLQNYYTTQVSDASSASVKADFLNRLQGFLGKPGAAGSLDTTFNTLQTSMQTLATSPDSYAARADMVLKAQDMANTLNSLSGEVQDMRQETENQIASSVTQFNQMLQSLEHVNGRIMDLGNDEVTRATVMDQRDRLVSEIAEMVDIQTDYRADGTVALTTRAGVGLLDVKASELSFEPVGAITTTSLFSTDDAENGVGRLLIRSPSGVQLDVARQGVFQSGSLSALLDLRDNVLVEAQSQIDQVAAGLAQAMSTVTTAGTAATSGAASGFEVDTAGVLPGNDITVNYLEGGVEKKVRIVNVSDTSKLPMDYQGGDNVRVLGVNFSTGATAAAAVIDTALGAGVAVTNPSGTTLQFLDDGAAGTTDIRGLQSHRTATATQDGNLAVPLFVDGSGKAFTNSVDGVAQKIGFAARITVNSAVARDNKLLVQYEAGGNLGDAARADFLIDQLNTMSFTTDPRSPPGANSFKLSGTVDQILSQTMNFQGENVAAALDVKGSTGLAVESLDARMQAETGVNVDEEMARLIELQSAYAANARVVSIVQDLLDALMNI